MFFLLIHLQRFMLISIIFFRFIFRIINKVYVDYIYLFIFIFRIIKRICLKKNQDFKFDLCKQYFINLSKYFVWVSVCLFVYNKRQKGWTDLAEFCVGPQMTPGKVYFVWDFKWPLEKFILCGTSNDPWKGFMDDQNLKN